MSLTKKRFKGLFCACIASLFLFWSLSSPANAIGYSPSGVDPYYKPTLASKPAVSARAAVIIEATTGEVVWEKNSKEQLPMASTTKIMTALVAIENYDIKNLVQIAPEAVGIEGSSIYLQEGEILTMEQLLYALLLASANDAATAIAIEVAGSVENFAEMMNQTANKLGLNNTNFTNPHGLDDPMHFTTASDLAKLTAYAMKNPTFKTIVSTYKMIIPLNGDEGSRVLVNHNKMLHSYEGAVGVKTGYTKKSGRCLVSAATRDMVTLIAVTLDAPSDWADHAQMLDYGFSLYEYVVLCGEREFQYTQSVVAGKEQYVILTNSSEISMVLKKGSFDDVLCTVELYRFAYAPVIKGQVVGRLVYSIGGEVVGESEVVAVYGVEREEY